MTKKEFGSDGSQSDWELVDCYYPQLLRVGRSAGLDLSEDRAKDDLLERLDAANVERVGYDEFEMDGELLELEPPQGSGSDGPKDKTVLYCLTRKETTDERVDRIRAALKGEGFELRDAGSENDKYAIVLPAEVDEDDDRDLNEMTKDELYEMASERDVDGRSEMTKAELVEALVE